MPFAAPARQAAPIDRTRREVALGLAGLLSACAAPPNTKTAEPVAIPVWPPAPDEPRFRYDTTLRFVGDVALETREAAMRRSLTGAPDPRTAKLFEKPGGVAARNGRLYVTDIARQSVVTLDVPGRRVFQFGVRDDDGRLHQPVAIARDDRAQVYVLDAARRKVRVYDDMGLYKRSIDVAKMSRPTGVAASVDGERVYVVDRSTPEEGRPAVVCFDGAGRERFRFGTTGSGAGEMHLPLNVAVGRNGHVHLLDSGNFRVQVFDRDGRFLRAIGQLGSVPGTFARPRGIAVSDEGWVFVGDAAFNNVQIFDAEGRLLLVVGDQGTRPVDEPGRWGLVAGIATDETGRLYVADQFFTKLSVIRRVSSEEGRRVRSMG